ncbi:hypothetical protein JCM10295v2_004336 [Rhodotorula toruloides]
MLGVVVHFDDHAQQRRAAFYTAQDAVAAAFSGDFDPVDSLVHLPLDVPHIDRIVTGQLVSLERYSDTPYTADTPPTTTCRRRTNPSLTEEQPSSCPHPSPSAVADPSKEFDSTSTFFVRHAAEAPLGASGEVCGSTVSAASSLQSSVPRPNLFSSVAEQRPRADRPSIRSVSSPAGRTARHTLPQLKQPYRPNVYNKLDREVANVVNSMPGLYVPIQVAEGRWTDESGVYNIGGRLYFCRILRNKQVMVRVGGGWLDLSQFIITHFGVANGLTISPSTSITANVGSEPQWSSSSTLRDSLTASQSSNSLRDFVAASISSAGKSDLGDSTSSLSVSRLVSGRLRDSAGQSSRDRTTPASTSTTATPRANRTLRPPLPVWRP